MELFTERLILRPFQETDLDDLYEFLSQLENDEFEGYPGITRESSREHLKQRVGSEEFCALVLKETGKVIGNIYCRKRDYDAIGRNDRRMESGPGAQSYKSLSLGNLQK